MAAYSRETRTLLVGTLGGIFALQVAAYALTGVGLVAAVLGEGGTGLLPVEALLAAGGNLGVLMLGVTLGVLLVRPDVEGPLLEYDDSVGEAVEAVARVTGAGRILRSAPGRYLVFVLTSMDRGARTAMQVVVAVAAAGIIPGVIATSGLGPNLISLILAVAGFSLVLWLVITVIASIILGIGMPTTVTYIILVSMLGPPLSQAFDIPLLAAHLFILYFGVIADITPPPGWPARTPSRRACRRSASR